MHTDTLQELPGTALPLPIQKRLKEDTRFLNLIRQIVCGYYGVVVTAISKTNHTGVAGRSKGSSKAAKAKQVMCYIAKRLCPKMTDKTIGEFLGGFTSASILYCVNTVIGECSVDRRTRQEVASIIHIVIQRGHELGEFWGSVDKEYFFVDLNNISVLRVSATETIIFTSGASPKLIEAIKERYYPQAAAQVREFKGTGLCLFEKK